MNSNFKPNLYPSQANVVPYPVKVSRRVGAMRAVTLGKKLVNVDFVFKTTRDPRMLNDKVLGKNQTDGKGQGDL